MTIFKNNENPYVNDIALLGLGSGRIKYLK